MQGQPDAAPGTRGQAPIAGLVALEAATASVVATWLGERGWTVCDAHRLGTAPTLLIVQIRFPRSEGPQVLAPLAARFAGVPTIVVSPTILPGTPSRSEAARKLGVAAVLALPLSGAELLTTVDALTGPA